MLARMRILAGTTLTMLLLACGDNGDMQITQTNPTSLDTGNTTGMGSNSGTSTPTASSPTTDSTTTDSLTEPTAGPQTTDPLTGGPTTTGGPAITTGGPGTDTDTDASSSSGDTGADTDLMKTLGHACKTDADCQALVGPDGVCQQDILGVYALPDGYCTTYCQLPDQQTTYQLASASCTMGADCVGLMGYFEACAHVCTDDAQCPRPGYECRVMPQISNPGDPKFCLMTEDNMIPP